MNAYETVIGLEVHAQLLTQSKLFCGCSTSYGAPPNTHVCPVCLGLPGALPVPNDAAVEMAVRAGLALECAIRPESRFARKNYFYPDLSKNYQISQFELPLCEHGKLVIEVDGAPRTVGIRRVHMEEDAAKNLHGTDTRDATLVDFNRAGVPLIEIVGEPDLRSGEEAEAYLKKLRSVLMFMGINDGNLEEGSFRCDANVSIRPKGSTTLGTRTELKNINSFRFVRKAIEHEVSRQEAIVSAGGKVTQETRTWSESQGRTVAMRSKEEAHDYRYFPDPDLAPLSVSTERIEAVRAALAELPDARRARWQTKWGLTPYDASVLGSHPKIADYFEVVAQALPQGKTVAAGETGKLAANFIQSEILRNVRTEGLSASFPVPPEHLAELLSLVLAKTLSGKMAKEVLAEMAASGRSAKHVVRDKGLTQLTDPAAIEAAVQAVIDAHPAEVGRYRSGKTSVFGFFVGQVMRATRGSADPALVNDVLKRLLESP